MVIGQSPYVVMDRDGGPASFEDRLAIWVGLAEQDGSEAARPLKPKGETADAAEQVNHAEFHGASPSLRCRFFFCNVRYTNFLNHSGSKLHSHQRMPRRMPRPTSPICTSGRVKSSFAAATRNPSVSAARMVPIATRVRNSKTFQRNFTLGCGVDKSLEPHWEHASKLRGFG